MDNIDQLANFPQGVNRYPGYALRSLLPVRLAAGFAPLVEVCPDQPNAAVAGNSMYEHRVSVPVGAYLWALSGLSAQAEGFRLQVIDTRTNQGLLSQPAFFGNVTGQGSPAGVKNCLGQTVNIKQPLCLLPKPRVIVEPAVLRVQLTNLSAAANKLQAALYFWVPDETRPDADLAADANLCRRAIRGQTIVQGQIVPQTQTADSPMARPATNVPFAITAPASAIVVPGAPGHRIAIHQLSLLSSVPQSIRLLNQTVDLMGQFADYQGGYYMPYQEEPHFVLDDGQAFIVAVAAGSGGQLGTVGGFLKYRMFDRWPL